MAFYMDGQNWHKSKEFNDEVLRYHLNYAKQLNVDTEKAKLESLKLDIKKQMNDMGPFTCLEFKHKGSTYEGVKIMQSAKDCPEFDLDFVIKGGEHLVADKSHPSWHELRVKNGKSSELAIWNKAQENGVLSPELVMNSFYGSLSKCDFIKDYNIIRRYHGPAVQMDVCHAHTDILWFQVDLAPAFYLEGNNRNERFSECYVAKSPDDKSCKNMWYRSYSTDEKRLMDKAGLYRKVVLRTLKAMRANSDQLLVLQSYHLKMAFFHVMDQYPDDRFWTIDKTGQRLIDVLAYIKNCLEEGEMPNYFNKNLNILKLGGEACFNLKNRIARLIGNEQRMINFLKNREESSFEDDYHNLSAKSISLNEENDAARQIEDPAGSSTLKFLGGCVAAAGLGWAAYKFGESLWNTSGTVGTQSRHPPVPLPAAADDDDDDRKKKYEADRKEDKK